MLDYELAGLFKKERKLMERRHKDMLKLRDVMRLLINEQPLEPRHENHPSHGDYKGWWECHIEPDWLLIYRIDKPKRKVVFYRTGSHSDLY